MIRPALLLAFGLAACGPTSVQQAENQCFMRARQASNPLAGTTVGVGSDGFSVNDFNLTVSSDFVQGRDPSAVYDQCVYQKSGQMPSRPLYDRPDWKG